MQLCGHCCKPDGTVTVLQTAACCRRRVEPNVLRYACNWPAWHFVIWILLLWFILKDGGKRVFLKCLYIFARLYDVICEKTVIFCALGVSNVITRSFNFCAEEILTSAQYPSSRTSHSWLSTIAYWIYVHPFSFFHVYTVLHLDIIKVFIHQLTHKWIVLKTVLKFTLKLTLKQLRHVSVQSPSSGSALFEFAKVTVVKIVN
jgi:hypothetical protein